MKLKQTIAYRFSENKKSYLIYYTILIASFTFLTILTGFNTENSRVGGLETATMIFLFISCANSFKEQFHLFLQNGISRKTGFYSFIISQLALTAMVTVIDLILGKVFGCFVTYASAFDQVFGSVFETKSILYYMAHLGWMFTAYFAIGMCGYFITTLYYRMNKALKIIVSVSVPCTIIVIFPLVDELLAGGKMGAAVTKFFAYLFGVYGDLHPINSMITCLGIGVIALGFAYLLTRKATIKKN